LDLLELGSFSIGFSGSPGKFVGRQCGALTALAAKRENPEQVCRQNIARSRSMSRLAARSPGKLRCGKNTPAGADDLRGEAHRAGSRLGKAGVGNVSFDTGSPAAG